MFSGPENMNTSGQPKENSPSTPKIENSEETKEMSLFNLLTRLKKSLAQSSKVPTSPPRGSEVTTPIAGDGVFYVDKLLKTYFVSPQEKMDVEDDKREECSLSGSPLKSKQERLTIFFSNFKILKIFFGAQRVPGSLFRINQLHV